MVIKKRLTDHINILRLRYSYRVYDSLIIARERVRNFPDTERRPVFEVLHAALAWKLGLTKDFHIISRTYLRHIIDTVVILALRFNIGHFFVSESLKTTLKPLIYYKKSRGARSHCLYDKQRWRVAWVT